jgi:hypothetical protein
MKSSLTCLAASAHVPASLQAAAVRVIISCMHLGRTSTAVVFAQTICFLSYCLYSYKVKSPACQSWDGWAT